MITCHLPNHPQVEQVLELDVHIRKPNPLPDYHRWQYSAQFPWLSIARLNSAFSHTIIQLAEARFIPALREDTTGKIGSKLIVLKSGAAVVKRKQNSRNNAGHGRRKRPKR